jgi:hypothetical protein
LAQQKYETERVSGKLESYLHSAYIIDRIYPNNGKDFGIAKSFKNGSTKTYARIPDPDICHNLTKLPDNFSLNDLPEDLDFDYSKYSKWMANKGIKFENEQTVESEFENEHENQMSDFEEMVESLVSENDDSVVDEEIDVESENDFCENVEQNDFDLKTSVLKENASELNETVSDMNTEGKLVKLYTLKGSKIMYSDTDFPINAVNSDQIDKVFLVVSEETSEVSKETSDCSKESFKPEKKIYEKPTKSSGSNVFVSGYVQTETISVGTNESNHQFRVRKKDNEGSDMHPRIKRSPKDVYGDRTCYSCRKVGHMAKDCPLNTKRDASDKKCGFSSKKHFTQTTTVMKNGVPISKGTTKQETEVVKPKSSDKKKSNFQKPTVNKPENEIKVTRILNRNEPIPDAFKKPSGSPKKATGLPK